MAHLAPFSERVARRYALMTGRRPFLSLAILLPLLGLCGWFGAGIHIRSNMEDLFPESTPAVQAAKYAREQLKSSSQLTVVFGSPSREANRKLASDFCSRIEQWPEIASVQCRRDIEFFRRNAALFLTTDRLAEIDADVRESIRRATEKDLLDDALLEGLEDEAPAPEAATATDTPGTATATAGSGEPPRKSRVPTDEELRQQLKADDIREWQESPDGTVLGVKVFPTVVPSDVDATARFLAKVDGLLAELKPTAYDRGMTVATSGDYAEVTQEIKNIRKGLAVTSGAALAIIALIQVVYFRRFRALVLMSIPLVAGTALTMAFGRLSIGYLNMITAFIFSMLFGMGNDFNVYTLSRYLEERSKGLEPLEAVVNTAGSLWSALHQAALTTSVAFFALVVLEFRGFSQFGLLAGVGVELALLSTIGLFPPLVMALHRIWPDRAVSVRQAEGMKWIGWFANKRVARITLVGGVFACIFAGIAANDLEFETNMRKLRTPPVQRAEAATHNLGVKFRAQAESRTDSPVLVVTDSIDHAEIIHRQIDHDRARLTRIRDFVSIYTFVPPDQEAKLAIIQRIRGRIEAKIDVLEGEDRKEAERALAFLQAERFGPADLPDFVRKRFLDTEGTLGRFVLLYPNGNLADARSVQEVIDQVGIFQVGDRLYQSTASFFILAEADAIVRQEGPVAVVLAAIAVLLVVAWHFRNVWLVVYSFVPLTIGFLLFLGVARGLGLELNLFSVTALPGILGIGIDGTTHILHRFWEDGDRADLRMILQQIGGAAWVALVTTCVGFAALLFQDNPGLKSIAWMATVGLLVVALCSNALVGGMLALLPPKRRKPGP